MAARRCLGRMGLPWLPWPSGVAWGWLGLSQVCLGSSWAAWDAGAACACFGLPGGGCSVLLEAGLGLLGVSGCLVAWGAIAAQ